MEQYIIIHVGEKRMSVKRTSWTPTGTKNYLIIQSFSHLFTLDKRLLKAKRNPFALF